MRSPKRRTEQQLDAFINDAESNKQLMPWDRGLARKYEKDTGKTINVRLPEHYAACLEWLAEKDNRSQHGELVHLLCEAIDRAIPDSD